jgi:hypothetical protein
VSLVPDDTHDSASGEGGGARLLPVPSRLVRDAVIHMTNEQPLVVDLFGLPTASDTALVCTNLRTLSGKRPVFADASDSVFLFPLAHVRFVEIPAASSGRAPADDAARHVSEGAAEESELEIDEGFLRRVREA